MVGKSVAWTWSYQSARSVTLPRGGSVERIMPTRARPTIGFALWSMQTIGSTV